MQGRLYEAFDLQEYPYQQPDYDSDGRKISAPAIRVSLKWPLNLEKTPAFP